MCQMFRLMSSICCRPEQNIHAADQIVQFAPVDIDQLQCLMLFAAEVKIPTAFLIEKGIEPLQLQIAGGTVEYLRRVLAQK